MPPPVGAARPTSPTVLESDRSAGRPPIVQPAVTIGFACTVATWAGWLALANPAVGASPMVVGMGVIGVWMLAAGYCGRFLGTYPIAWAGLTGGLAGIITAAVGVMLLGSKLVEAADPSDITRGEGTPHPDAGLAIVGFVVLGAVVGAIGAVVGRSGGARADTDGRGWFARLALVSVLAAFPLLLLGGAVTSTESGMAVTGWPDSFGANMFLYPISLMSQPRVFMEHAHRLFGAMVGLTILVQWITALVVLRRNWIESLVGVLVLLGVIGVALAASGIGTPLGFAAAASSVLAAIWMIASLARLQLVPAAGALLALVVAQGIMGGTRVTENSAVLAIVHGVAGQTLVALTAALALCATRGYREAESLAKSPLKTHAALALVLVAQVLFGAAYRHLRRGESTGASHALWSHIGLSIVVVVLAVVTGGLLAGRKEQRSDRPRGAVRVGRGLSHVVGLQFLLGWAALGVVHTSQARGEVPTAEQLEAAAPVPIWEVLVTTAHHANGALLAVMVALAVCWAWRLRPGGSPQTKLAASAAT